MFCREHAVQLHSRRHELEKLGAKLHFIGNGGPHFIAGFREVTGVTSPIYSDTRREAYQALEFKRSVRSTFRISSFGHMFRALKAGHRQGKVMGDPWQQGGVIAVAPGDRLLYYFASDGAGDYPLPADDLVGAISRVGG